MNSTTKVRLVLTERQDTHYNNNKKSRVVRKCSFQPFEAKVFPIISLDPFQSDKLSYLPVRQITIHRIVHTYPLTPRATQSNPKLPPQLDTLRRCRQEAGHAPGLPAPATGSAATSARPRHSC